MSWKIACVVLAVACGVALATPQKYVDCGSKGVAAGYVVDLTPCPSLPCTLKKGTNATITVTGKSTSSVVSASTVIHGIIGGVPLPFPSSLPDPCNSPDDGFVTRCPITSGQTFNYTVFLTVLPSYPTLSRLVVKWEVQDQGKNDFFCFEVPAAISN